MKENVFQILQHKHIRYTWGNQRQQEMQQALHDTWGGSDWLDLDQQQQYIDTFV